ncbi:MAG: dihydrolipoyl dehydrogenase [Polyangiaceae bacterium]
MAETLKADACIIGAGTGGYPCAIKLGQLGKRVVIVEREAIGGVCLNWGCIPSKAVIQAADFYERTKKAAAEMGIAGADASSVDMPRLQEWKSKIVERLTGGVGQLLKAGKCEVLRGQAKVAARGVVEVSPRDGPPVRVEAPAIVVASGARPIELPGVKIDEKRILSSRGVLDLTEVPARVVVVGGGIIGLELGTALRKLGSEVTVVELLDTLLYGVDPDAVRWVARKLKALEVEVLLEHKVSSVADGKGGALVATVTDKDGKDPRAIECEKLLLSIGFRPNSGDMGLEALGVALDKRGHIVVNERLETSVAGIYAVGDVTGPPYLAHRATKQGVTAAEVIAGHHAAYDVRAMPSAIFTDPEIATVGLSEAQAREQGFAPKTGKFPFSALGKAQVHEHPAPGVCKIVSDAKTGLLLGAVLAGHGVNDLIAEVALGIEMGAMAEDLALTVHPHPTMSEAVMEAAEANAFGKSIHAL